MTALDSPRNPRVKGAAELRDRRARDRTGLTLVDGIRELTRALDAGVAVEEAFVDEARLTMFGAGAGAAGDGAALLRRLRELGVPVHPSSPAVLERVGFGDRAEGIVAVIRPAPAHLADLRLPPDPLVVVLEAVEKPGNLGAVLRSADGAGADAVILADPRTDLYNPNAIRASLGTIFRVPVAAGASSAVASFLRDNGIRALAARVDGATSHTHADLRGGIALVLGSEATGLGPVWRDPDIAGIRVPMLGAADSLNVSVAAAVLLYEARRQRSLLEHSGPPDA